MRIDEKIIGLDLLDKAKIDAGSQIVIKAVAAAQDLRYKDVVISIPEPGVVVCSPTDKNDEVVVSDEMLFDTNRTPEE